MLLDKLAFIENKYDELSVKISDPSIMANQNEWRKLCKEHAELEIIVNAYRAYKKVIEDLEANKEMLQEEIGKLEADIEQKKAELAEVQAKLGGPTEEGNTPVDAVEQSDAGENGGDDSETAQLKAREKELISEITTEQMKLVALRKQLEEMSGNEMMANYGKEE